MIMMRTFRNKRWSVQELKTTLDEVEATLHIIDILIIAREYLKYDVAYSGVIVKALERVRTNFERCMMDPDASMNRVYAEYLSCPIDRRR